MCGRFDLQAHMGRTPPIPADARLIGEEYAANNVCSTDPVAAKRKLWGKFHSRNIITAESYRPFGSVALRCGFIS
jgi:hypothetical protein